MTARAGITALVRAARAWRLLTGSRSDTRRARRHLELHDAFTARAEARLLVAQELGGSIGGRRHG
ncbi:hypothetical protein SAMN02799631_00372 [Methylobacterium sp. 174MFSha1.1]|uniref:hypothetical protein n=1 Tax=Methylobacterium sp. 174MFSha1.1 TaxID=1502749 RepID=UPI0008DF1D73|nr:hypothetical protein [Methylobacterium sp. 174MFSha1.1]SFU38627.1 hypothetical protein SAMN02799631_00372 [Methylobacterium sp. 174MFSha1.1]